MARSTSVTEATSSRPAASRAPLPILVTVAAASSLRERGLDVTRPVLVGIDGAKALRKAVVDVFDHPVIQRCQLHKIRNVQDRLPQRLRGPVGAKMRAAYHADSALDAEAQLSALAR